MPLSKVSATSLSVHLWLSTDSNYSDTPVSRDAVVAKERCMWSKAFLRSSCATKKGVFHSFASSLARSRTTTHCEATVLRRKSVWNELNCVSPTASTQKCPNSFLTVDKEEIGLNFVCSDEASVNQTRCDCGPLCFEFQ